MIRYRKALIIWSEKQTTAIYITISNTRLRLQGRYSHGKLKRDQSFLFWLLVFFEGQFYFQRLHNLLHSVGFCLCLFIIFVCCALFWKFKISRSSSANKCLQNKSFSSCIIMPLLIHYLNLVSKQQYYNIIVYLNHFWDNLLLWQI